MESSNHPVNVFEGERKRIDIFQTFWDRRIEIESNCIRELEGLVFDVPGPAGSLKDALDALNALLRIEIDQRVAILRMLRDLRGDFSSRLEDWGSASQTYWTSAADGVGKKLVGLAKKKSELTPQEAFAERAALGTNTERVVQRSITQLLIGKLKNQPSTHKSKTPVNSFPSFNQFFYCDIAEGIYLTNPLVDQTYRSLVGQYNDYREDYIGESMQIADKLVIDESKTIAMIQKMISAFADSQSDFASALNSGSTQCRFMANMINSSTEGHDSLIRIQTSISVAFGQPHLYKNFWFNAGDLRSPTILFGYIPDSDSKGSTLKSMMRLFKVLVEHDARGARVFNDVTDFRSEQFSKLAHDVETCWDTEKVDGGDEVVRLFEMNPEYGRLALHFLWRTPRPLVDPPIFGHTAGLDDILSGFCDNCNRNRSYSERKMLFEVLQILADYSNRGEMAPWKWWFEFEHVRGKCWYRALTWGYPRYTESKIVAIFVLWVLCTDLEEGKFVWSRVRMKELQSSWEQWVHHGTSGL